MGEVVWVEGQKVHAVQAFREAVAAVVFHYQRVFFGPQFGMGKA